MASILRILSKVSERTNKIKVVRPAHQARALSLHFRCNLAIDMARKAPEERSFFAIYPLELDAAGRRTRGGE